MHKKDGSILTEILVILAIAIVLGTGVHLLRPDKKQRIEWVSKTYKDCTSYKKQKPTKEKKGAPVSKASIELVKNDPPKVQDPVKSNPPPPNPIPSTPTKKTDPPPEEQNPQEKKDSLPELPPDGPIKMISIEEAIALHEEGDVPFLDARRTRFYKSGHIPRAKSMSVWEAGLDQRIEALFDEIPFEMPVVVYCMTANCEDSHMLAQNLKDAGYLDIKIIKGGFPEWKKKDMPIETSSEEEEEEEQ